MQGAFIKNIVLRYIYENNQKNLFSIGEIAKSIGITRKIILNYEAKRIKASLLLRWFCRLRIEIISRNNFIRWSVWFFQEICIPTDSLRISNNVFIKWYYGAVLYKMIYFFALIEKCNKKSGKNYKKSLAIFIVICYNVYKAVA